MIQYRFCRGKNQAAKFVAGDTLIGVTIRLNESALSMAQALRDPLGAAERLIRAEIDRRFAVFEEEQSIMRDQKILAWKKDDDRNWELLSESDFNEK